MIGLRSMKAFPFWRTAARLAWRELRSARTRAAFITVTIAISIASISGVHGAASVARQALHGDSRAWLAGDVGVDMRDPISEEGIAALDAMKSSGIDWTLVSTALTMASSDQSSDPGLISVKAVDPAKYPFYGRIGLAPSQRLSEALQDATVAVSDEVLERLEVRVGDAVKIGAASFHISALIQSEPDRFAGAIGVGMRCILSRGAYLRTGIEQSGNSVKYRALLKVPAGVALDRVRTAVKEIFPEGSVHFYSSAYQRQTEAALSFLTVASFLTLVLGSLGVAIAIRQHAEDSIPSLAIMKMLGARSFETGGVFFVQIAAMMVAALAIAIPLGFTVRVSVLSLVGKYLVLPPVITWDLRAALGSGVAGLVSMLPVLVAPARLIRHMRPAIVLRRGFESHQTAVPGAFKSLAGWVAMATASAAFLVIATRMLRSWTSALVLLGAMGVCAGVAWLLSVFAFAALRRLTTFLKPFGLPALRHGLDALDRTGQRSRLLIVVLAIALTMLTATFEASRAVVRTAIELMPEQRNTLYVTGFRDAHSAALRDFLEHIPDVEGVQMISQVTLPLRSWNNNGAARGLANISYLAMCEADPAPAIGAHITKVTMAEDLASQLGVQVGSPLEFEARGRSIPAVLAAVVKLTPAERFWFTVKLDCRALDPSSLTHQAMVRVPPDRIAGVRRAIRSQYPTLAFISADEISETVAGISGDITALARVVTWYAMGSGLAVLMAMIAASRGSRLREIAIFSALGARRVTVREIYSVEFAAIGLISGCIASLLTWGFTSVVLSVVLHRAEAAVEWSTLGASIFGATALTLAAGWIPAHGLLKRKPLEILRVLP
jgi:putative ABC transport system permease protein